MNDHDPARDHRSTPRMNRRDIVKLAAAIPALGAIGAAPLIKMHDDTVFAQSNTGTATPSHGTPVACTSPVAGSPVATPAAQILVKMTDELRFDPEELTVYAGETVTWLNLSNMPHTATCDPAQNPVAKSHPEYVSLPGGATPWGSALLQPGESFTYTFTTPGEYRYFCIPHVLSGMRGLITVKC